MRVRGLLYSDSLWGLARSADGGDRGVLDGRGIGGELPRIGGVFGTKVRQRRGGDMRQRLKNG